MDPFKFIKEKLGDEVSKKALSSPQTYEMAKLMLGVKNPYSFEGLKMLTDLGLEQTAQAYRQKNPVFFTTAFFPDELIHAIGGVPFAPEVAAATATALDLSPELLKQAEKIGMSRDLCSFHRVAAAGDPKDYFPQPHVYLASSHLCDGGPQLFRYLARKNHRPFYLLDIPSKNDESSIRYVSEQLQDLVSELTNMGLVTFDKQALKHTIELSNQGREAQIELNNTRSQYPGIIPGEQAINLVYLHFLCQGLSKTPEIYKTIAREVRNKGEKDQSDLQSPKILWCHLRPFYQNDIFTILEQELGVHLAFEEMNYVYWQPLDPERPFDSLAKKVLANPFVGPIENRLSALEQMVNKFDIDGIVHLSHWGCRQAVGGVSLINHKSKGWGVNFLNLDTDCVDEDNYFSGQIRTRLESFVEMLNF